MYTRCRVGRRNGGGPPALCAPTSVIAETAATAQAVANIAVLSFCMAAPVFSCFRSKGGFRPAYYHPERPLPERCHAETVTACCTRDMVRGDGRAHAGPDDADRVERGLHGRTGQAGCDHLQGQLLSLSCRGPNRRRRACAERRTFHARLGRPDVGQIVPASPADASSQDGPGSSRNIAMPSRSSFRRTGTRGRARAFHGRVVVGADRPRAETVNGIASGRLQLRCGYRYLLVRRRDN